MSLYGQRREALELAGRKLAGQRYLEARSWIMRSSDERLRSLVLRLQSLPDIDVDPADRRKMRTLTEYEIATIRAERANGAGLKDLAERFHVSMNTISRCANGVGAYGEADE